MKLPPQIIVFFCVLLFGTQSVCRAQPAATNLWMLPLANYDSDSSPALAPDGTIYQATFDGRLVAVSPQGEIKWIFKTPLEIESSPAVADDGTIYFGSRDRKFYAVSPDGKLKWTFATGAWIDSSPAIAADGTVYFGSWDGNFYALNPDGSLKWKFPAGGIVDSSPAIGADGTVYFGSHDGNFYALKADGKLRWKFPTQRTNRFVASHRRRRHDLFHLDGRESLRAQAGRNGSVAVAHGRLDGIFAGAGRAGEIYLAVNICRNRRERGREKTLAGRFADAH